MAFNLTHTVALPIILVRRTMVQSTGTNSGWDQYYNTIEFEQWGVTLVRAIDVMEWYPMGYKFVLIWCSHCCRFLLPVKVHQTPGAALQHG